MTKNYTSEAPQTQARSTITYVWLKDSKSVPQTSNSRIHENVLVVTPTNDTDFGTYECNATNGVSSTRCRIQLKRGWTKTGKYEELKEKIRQRLYKLRWRNLNAFFLRLGLPFTLIRHENRAFLDGGILVNLQAGGI